MLSRPTHGSSPHASARSLRIRRPSALATAAVTAAAAAVLAAGGQAVAAVPGAGGAATPPTTCSGVVRIDSLGFSPAEIPAGQTSTAMLRATNCTGQTQSVSETWAATWVSSGVVGIPPGCPAIDPLPRGVTFAPYAHTALSTGYLVFAGCTADALRLTVTISQAGALVDRASATLLIDHPSTTG